MVLKMVLKNTTLEVKDIDKAKGIVKVAFSKMGVYDTDNDRISKGAFAKTFSENRKRIKHLKNHNVNQVVGVIQELYEEGDFAIMVSKLASTTLGKDTLIEYQEGIITEHSHGFTGVKGKYEENERGGIDYSEVKSWEVSTLTGWGANPYTEILDVKDAAQAEQLLKRFEKSLRVSEFSEDYLIRLENTYKAIGEILKTSTDSRLSKDTDSRNQEEETRKAAEAINAFLSTIKAR